MPRWRRRGQTLTIARVVLAGNTSNRFMPHGPMSSVGAR
jgi:hypothetical protein